MRIAAVDPERKFAGGEAQVIGLTLELLRSGHQAELVCDPDGELWRRGEQAGVVCRPLKIRNSLDIAAGVRLRALLTRGHYDVLHFHTARAHALAPYAMGRAGALVVTRRMDYVPNRWFAPWLYNRAVNGVAAISHGVAQALVQAGVNRDGIKIIPSGVDCSRFAPPDRALRQRARAALDLSPHEIAVGTVGSLVPRKGHRVLIDAMALAADQINHHKAIATKATRLRCFIAGSGPLHDLLHRRITVSHLSDTVRLLGAVDDAAVLLNALDIFVMPSLNEGMGVAAMEAAAAGLPVIASAAGGLPEVVDDGSSGILVKPGDPLMLAHMISRLAADRPLRCDMGSAGRRRATQNWTIQLMAKRTLELYHTCLDSTPKGKALRHSS